MKTAFILRYLISYLQNSPLKIYIYGCFCWDASFLDAEMLRRFFFYTIFTPFAPESGFCYPRKAHTKTV